jgi:hypothetical protein
MAGLDGNQSAEPAAEHRDWPDPQRAAGSEENDAKPANGVPIESPELPPVCVCRQIGVEQPDQPESGDDPAVGTILAHTRAQISATENGNGRQHEKCDREGDQGRMGEESSRPSRAEDGEAEKGKCPYDGDEHQSGCGHHGHQTWTISLHMG